MNRQRAQYLRSKLPGHLVLPGLIQALFLSPRVHSERDQDMRLYRKRSIGSVPICSSLNSALQDGEFP